MDIEAAYQQTLEYLYSFVDHSLTRSFRFSPEKFDLARMQVLMAALGDPQKDYPIIHIAGTKGKGSVSALCASALRSAGYKTGLYTSPHLHDYAERIALDGEPIPHADLIELVEAIKPHIEAIPGLTTFEITTALALLYFSRQQAEAVVLEVGLGGRLDATNVVTPQVAVITSISYDHTYVLGHTLTEIAGEKGGIIKPGIPVVVAPQEEAAREALERIAEERAAPLTLVGRDYFYSFRSHSLDSQTLLVWPAASQPAIDACIQSGDFEACEQLQLTIPLLGIHQIENAATAYAALETFREGGIAISAQAIREGFKQVVWPGRFEILQRDPPLVVDSAHNRDSALRLRLALDDYFPNEELILVFGASEDKDVYGMFRELMPRIRQVIATKSFHPRAIEPETLVELAHQFARPAAIVSDVAEALEEALRIADDHSIVLVAGSLFVAAGARETWYKANLRVSGETHIQGTLTHEK
jgi:dihydrofolate synthase/folylpolyglutamate synthase